MKDEVNRQMNQNVLICFSFMQIEAFHASIELLPHGVVIDGISPSITMPCWDVKMPNHY